MIQMLVSAASWKVLAWAWLLDVLCPKMMLMTWQAWLSQQSGRPLDPILCKARANALNLTT
jgi:hypothetical protein